MNEASLVATAKSGETAALELLFVAHKEKLFRTVFRITRNQEDAEDAMQDSLFRAFLHLKSFDGRSTFSTWLTRICINSALITLRKKRRFREVTGEGGCENSMVPEAADFAPNPEQHYAQEERERLIRKAVAGLRLSIRRPMELHTLSEYSIEEMAGEIGVSVAAAKARLHRAKLALRRSHTLRSIKDRDRLLAIGNRIHSSEKCSRHNGGNSFNSTSTTTINNLRPGVTLHRRQATLEAK